MKSPNHTPILVAVAFLLPFLPRVARADMPVPPNDYTGFLYEGGHYFPTGMVILVACLCIPLCICLWKNRLFRRGVVAGKTLAATLAIEILLVVGIILFNRSRIIQAVLAPSSQWPDLHYYDTPELRAEYDRKCIDWYNAHRGDWPGEHSYIYWRAVPRMRPGAPEAVTNAYEAFRESLRKGNDRLQKASDAASDYESGVQ